MLVGSGLFASLTFLSTSFAVLVNRTIDDGNGDPVTGFQPIYQSIQPAWQHQSCGGCYIQPQPGLAFDGTWTSATYHPSLQNVNITLEFTGVAIWVFFILANKSRYGPGTITNTQCNFTLDQQHAGSFSHDPDMSTFDQQYNVSVFVKTGLSNTSHQLIIAANDYPISTFINFDYAIYTVELPDPPTSTLDASFMTKTSSSHVTSILSPPSTSTATSFASLSSSVTIMSKAVPARTYLIIIGSVLGVVVLTTIALVLLWLRCRYQSRQGTVQEEPTPNRFRHLSIFDNIDGSLSHRTSQTVVSARISRIFKVRPIRQRQINEKVQDHRRQRDVRRSYERAAPASIMADSPPGESGREIGRLRNELQDLRNIVGSIQRQQHSDRALSPTDDEPPPYNSGSHSPIDCN